MDKLKFSLTVAWISIFIASCNYGNKQHGNGTSNSEAIASAVTKYQYSLHPVIGKKYYYSITTQTKTKLEVEDKEVETGNESEIGLVYEALKDSANNLVIKLSYNKLHIVIKKSGQDDNVIDADAPPNEQTTVEKLLSSIKGSSIFLTYNAKGDIINTSGNKEISDKIMAGVANEEPKMKQLIQQLINKFTGESFIKDNIKEGLKLFPDTAVNIGDSWNKKTNQTSDVSFETAMKYTLTSVEDNITEIEAEGQISSTKNNTANILGQQVTTDLNGEQTGRFKTDITTGIMLSGKTNATIKGTIQMLGRDVPISIKIKKEIVLKQ